MSTVNTIHDETIQHYSKVTKLIHYVSKFEPDGHIRHSKLRRFSSVVDLTDRLIEGKRFRLVPMWSEWNEVEINAEPWDAVTTGGKRREAAAARVRADTKTTISSTNGFDDPEGKVELPPLLQAEQWKRPNEFLPSDKTPVVVDPDLGLQNFDLITSNEHLHYNQTMRNIISQIIALWNICRKVGNKSSDFSSERTWRPWEHIYALNKVSKPPFITPYNPAGKYVVRLFFLGSWRKIIIDDTIPFDSKNQCLLPQTALSYELWPMLLSKALLKILSLDFNTLHDFPEQNETSIIHSLTSWIPEPIPLKYTHTEKVWNFLRYDRSNRQVSDNDCHSMPSFGPLPLFKWAEPSDEIPMSIENSLCPSKQQSVDLQDDKSSKKGRTSAIAKDAPQFKPTSSKESRPNTRKPVVTVREGSTPASSMDQAIPEAPKMIVFGTVSQSQPVRLSSFSEAANRSERLRHYNLNETFSTSILLTSIRDIPLEPPPPPEFVPAWKQIRPKKTQSLPSAEPAALQESKPDERWIEITSPYINYPTASALQTKPKARSHSLEKNVISPSRPSRLTRRRKSDMSGIDEVDDNKNSDASEILTTVGSMPSRKELNTNDATDKLDESMRCAANKFKRELSVDRSKLRRKSSVFSSKLSFDALSVKSKDNDIDPIMTPVDVKTIENQIQQQNLPKKSHLTPKVWMNFNDFCTCFTSIIVFHNPDGYQYMHKHTDIKFTPYQRPVATPVQRERKKETIQPVIPQIPNLQDDKSVMYLFVDSTRDTLDKNIELLVSLTCVSRWLDAIPLDGPVLNEKVIRGSSVSIEKPSIDPNVSKPILSQKEIISQGGSLIVDLYSWKSVSQGQPILRLHTTTTKAALLTLPPGRHVLKLVSTCSFAYNLQILCDTNDFMLGDEDHLMNRLTSVPEDAECQIRAEELFLALDDSIQNFHLVDQRTNELHDFLRYYCQQAPELLQIPFAKCLQAFHQALYVTLRTMLNMSGSTITADTQFAWRCYTNDLSTPDILAAYEPKRPTAPSAGRHSARTGTSSSVSSSSKKSSTGKDKSTDEKSNLKHHMLLTRSSPLSEIQESSSDLLTRELSVGELRSVTNIQKSARGFLQRRIMLARTGGTEKNLLTQRLLQSTMTVLKHESAKSASLLFKNLLSTEPRLVQCFGFYHDDWNMITYRDYHGIYSEQPANTWFVLFREIFYVITENLIAAKLLSHVPNSVLRVINNDTYEELPLVFNRLVPHIFTKNKNGYTFLAEGKSTDQSISNGRFRLRLITSYTHLPEIHTEQITSAFITKEIMDYYIPNREQLICRYRVIVADDINQTGRGFHLASLRFQTSNSDVLMRLTVFDNNEELLHIEGQGCLVVPSILFMRNVTNTIQQPPPLPPPPIQPSSSSTRPTSKAGGGGGSRKRDGSRTNLGDTTPLNTANRLDKDAVRPESRSAIPTIEVEEKYHKYIIQVTVLHKSWPLTPSQWHFIEHIKDQEKNESKISNRQQTPTKTDRSPNTSATTKRTSQGNTGTLSSATGKGRSSSTGSKGNTTTATTRPSTAKATADKILDKSRPHWILQVVSDADKMDELTIKKDTERQDELMNIKKAWETLQAGRAEKAMKSRQKFLESLQLKVDDQPPSQLIENSESQPNNGAISSPIIEQQETIRQSLISKKSSVSSKKTSAKEEPAKQVETMAQIKTSPPPIDEPLLNESPSKPKLILPLLNVKPFLKQKLPSKEPIISDTRFEQEDIERRQKSFLDFTKRINDIRLEQKIDQNNRHKEKLRQLEEYIDLQTKIDQARQAVDASREAFRQRFLENERKRLEEITLQEQKFISKGKAINAAGTKKKKN
ncbi:unnamed protein product [Adineta ricciae]|uniref:Calpain catalytic domain-containing protein n=1 Tax=Adineta ricciae TaxID=249248 RepID=A0A815B6D9_ADIRI|nr:unnamed protein product [Adineta ricciae]